MKYIFKYRRKLFWKSVTVVGHSYNRDLDRVSLLLENGGIREVPQWSKCECKLGVDWVLAKKKAMEKESGQTIHIDRDMSAK